MFSSILFKDQAEGSFKSFKGGFKGLKRASRLQELEGLRRKTEGANLEFFKEALRRGL